MITSHSLLHSFQNYDYNSRFQTEIHPKSAWNNLLSQDVTARRFQLIRSPGLAT